MSAGAAAADFDLERVAAAPNSASVAISGGMVAEKKSVCRFSGQLADDAPHVGEEAHVQHAVHFVEDEDFDVVEIDGALLHEIEQAARGGDDDIHAVF